MILETWLTGNTEQAEGPALHEVAPGWLVVVRGLSGPLHVPEGGDVVSIFLLLRLQILLAQVLGEGIHDGAVLVIRWLKPLTLELLEYVFQRHSVLESHAENDREAVEKAGDCRTFLGGCQEDFSQLFRSWVAITRDVDLQLPHIDFGDEAASLLGHFSLHNFSPFWSSAILPTPPPLINPRSLWYLENSPCPEVFHNS